MLMVLRQVDKVRLPIDHNLNSVLTEPSKVIAVVEQRALPS